MQSKYHELLPPLSLFALLGFLVLIFLAFAPQSVEVKVYDVHTGALLSDVVVENRTPARRQRTPAGWLFWSVNQRLSVGVSATDYLPSEASWHASHPWILRGQLDVRLSPMQLTGIVRDAQTGLSLPGAEVWIGTTRLVADASGKFWLSFLSGDMPVSAWLDGYEPWHGEVLWEGSLLRRELLTVYLQPSRVGGQVCDQEIGEPSPAAAVTAAGQRWIAERMGRFRLCRLWSGDNITVEREGFLPTEVIWEDPFLQDELLTVDLRSNFIEGQVRWQETGDPVSGATVTAVGQQWVTDQMGRFRLHRLRLGEAITVEREGFWPAKVTYTGQPLNVALRDRRAQVVVRSALEGVDLSDLRVTRDGQRLMPVYPSVFELQVYTAGGLLEATADGHWPARGRLGAPRGQSVDKIVLVLQPRVLTLTVRDDYAGWPLEGALISSSPARQADARGQVTLSPAIPGMVVTVKHPGYVSQTLQYDGLASEVEVRLVPHTIRGVVVDADTGRLVPGAVLRQDGRMLVRTGPDGSFRLEGLTERPTFTVRTPGYQPAQVGTGASPVLPRSCVEDTANGGPCWEIRLVPFEARGVYIPFGLLYSRQRTLAVLDMIASTELNAVVVDVKGDRGGLAYGSDLPLAMELGVSVSGMIDIHEFLTICRQRGIYTIARLVVFKDNPLAHGKPELAIKQADGSVWLDREKLGWANPFREEVWDYNIGIAQEVAQLGFDEVQLDYVRFPSDGDLDKIVYEEEDAPETKTTAIRTFMTRMRESLEPYDVFLSVDVFGLTLVVDPQSDMGIGQRVIDIAPFVDFLCPMVYPSTFITGNMGIANPALHPYKVVLESLRQGMARTSTLIRPWLQAYSLYGVKYGLEQQRAQRRAAEMVGASGWIFWNAGGRYDERLFRRRTATDIERLNVRGMLIE